MFNPGSTQGYQNVTDKIRMKTIVYGAKTLMTEFRLAAGADLPEHQHPHEQTGYLVAGRIDLTIDGRTQTVRPGRQLVHPGEYGPSGLRP